MVEDKIGAVFSTFLLPARYIFFSHPSMAREEN
jgi:hypothetical protein